MSLHRGKASPACSSRSVPAGSLSSGLPLQTATQERTIDEELEQMLSRRAVFESKIMELKASTAQVRCVAWQLQLAAVEHAAHSSPGKRASACRCYLDLEQSSQPADQAWHT